MTKINKLCKSTFVIAILSFLLVAVLAFGGTYAYFSDTSNSVASGDITLGRLIISETTGLTESSNLVAEGLFAVPNEKVLDTTVETSIDANIGYYVRAVITSTFTLADNTPDDDTKVHECNADCSQADQSLASPIIYTIVSNNDTIMGDKNAELNNSEWFQIVDATTNTTYLYLAARQTANLDIEFDIVATVNPTVGDGESQHFMGATFTISVQFQACQADYIDEAGVPENDLTDATVKDSAWANFTSEGLESVVAQG